MFKSVPAQDSLIINDTATASGTNASGVTWTKTGLTYVDLSGCGHVSFQTTGTFNCTQAYEVSNDLTNWQNCPVQNVSTVPLAENTGVAGTATGIYEFPVMGFLYFRIRISAYTSGTYNVRVMARAGSAPHSTQPTQTALDTTPTTVISTSQYPNGATAVAASSGTVSNATATATLAGTSGKTTYITGFSVSSTGATAASVVSPTVSHIVGGVTLTYTLGVVAGANTNVPMLTQTFNPAVPASGTNTSIAVSVPAYGAGNTNVTVNAFGYQL